MFKSILTKKTLNSTCIKLSFFIFTLQACGCLWWHRFSIWAIFFLNYDLVTVIMLLFTLQPNHSGCHSGKWLSAQPGSAAWTQLEIILGTDTASETSGRFNDRGYSMKIYCSSSEDHDSWVGNTWQVGTDGEKQENHEMVLGVWRQEITGRDGKFGLGFTKLECIVEGQKKTCFAKISSLIPALTEVCFTLGNKDD